METEEIYNRNKDIELETMNKANDTLKMQLEEMTRKLSQLEEDNKKLQDNEAKIQDQLKKEIASHENLRNENEDLKRDMTTITTFQLQQAEIALKLATGFRQKHDLKSLADNTVA